MYSAKELAIARLIKPDIEVAQLDVTDLAILQLVRKATGGGSGVYNATIENGIATFGGVVASSPLVSLLLNIPISQTGSGTQSPDNIRDFVGVSGVTITRNNGVDTGDTYPISFGQTVYSAILDVLNGKLYLIDEIKTIDENSGVTRATTNVFYLPDFFDVENDTESINCNIYERGENKSTGGGVVSNPDYSFCCRTTSNQLYIKDVRFNTIADYNDYLANNPVKIAVKLATPIEIDITPTVINTLIGENVIFADVANVTECKYTRK